MNDDNNNEDIYKVEDDDINYTDKKEEREDLMHKLIKYGIIAFVALIVLVLLIAIFYPKGSSKKEVVAKEVTLNSGDKYTLDYSKGTYSWTSSNPDIAKVSDDGEIVGLKNGETTITITVGKETVTYKVRVENVDEAVVLTNIKMEKNTVELEKDKSYKMNVTLTPSNATNAELKWTSSNEKVATVKDGEITAVGPGTCMVTVSSTNGNSDTCLVKVVGDGNYNPIEKIKIVSTDVSLNKGTSYNLSYEVVPEDSVNLITWKSSDEKIATVENGVVYALAGGTVKVTAQSGDLEEEVNVTVIEEKREPDFILNQSEISLPVGNTYTLVPSSNIELTWVSYDINVASVDQSGNVTAKAVGETTVVAKAANGSSYTCKVTVTGAPTPSQETITLNTNTLSMNIGDKVRLVETVTPTNNVTNVTWASSDSEVASVNNGEVTAKKNGTTTITATLPNGSKAECVVTVSTKVIKAALVTLNANKITLKVGASSTLTATVLPSNTTNKTITWSSSNPDVATVDKNGKVTAIKEGSAKIYAKTENGVFDSCGVVVEKK